MEEIEGQDPVDGRWTSCGRAGAAEIAWEVDGSVDGLWTGGSAEIAWEEAGDGGAKLKGMIRWTGGGRAVDGLVVRK